MERKGHEFGADPAGKVKMIVQCVAIPGVLFFRMADDAVGARFPEAPPFFWWVAVVLVWASLLITVWSGIGYVRKAAIHLRVGL